MTALREALDRAAAELARAGVPSPRVDAEILAAHLLGVDRSRLVTATHPPDRYDDLIRQRAARVPLQHLTGTAYFRHLELAVGPGVFVPRPETEVVAQAAIDEALRRTDPVVVDLCTGSAAIALAIAQEVPGARVHAVEREPEAHAWAARNCAGTTVDLRLGDAGAAFPELSGSVDVVVANPPYVPDDERHLVDPEVRDHDPEAALWGGGADGLDGVRLVAAAAARLLKAGGLVVVEHSDRQAQSAPAVFSGDDRSRGCWSRVTVHPDLTGRPRFTTARRTELAEGTQER